jgi:hypothetical protein
LNLAGQGGGVVIDHFKVLVYCVSSLIPNPVYMQK